MLLLKSRDILQVNLSDLHSGSNYALFVNRVWHGNKGANHTPNSYQIKIRNHFEETAAEIKQQRSGKRVQLVINGDAIDGDHHNSHDICSHDEKEQADIHIELMNEFQKRIGWQGGDEIYYTEGTQTHVHESEHYIAEQMNAVPDETGNLVHPLLKLKSNGVMTWYYHTGPTRGKGANEGGPVRAWLKNIYYEAVKDNHPIPDVVYTGHVHDPTFAAYEYRKGMNFQIMYGIIVPSWQMKTRFAREHAAVSVNKIGAVTLEVKSDGTRGVPRFYVMETQ